MSGEYEASIVFNRAEIEFQCRSISGTWCDVLCNSGITRTFAIGVMTYDTLFALVMSLLMESGLTGVPQACKTV